MGKTQVFRSSSLHIFCDENPMLTSSEQSRQRQTPDVCCRNTVTLNTVLKTGNRRNTLPQASTSLAPSGLLDPYALPFGVFHDRFFLLCLFPFFTVCSLPLSLEPPPGPMLSHPLLLRPASSPVLCLYVFVFL